ncbi:MAG: hypothetical protein RLZZ227_2029 [Pseudomonadota bacterium]|jgi:hypothetical protein
MIPPGKAMTKSLAPFASASPPRRGSAGLRLLLAAALLAAAPGFAQQSIVEPVPAALPLPRLPASILAVAPPSTRVSGLPGAMQIVERGCTSTPLNRELRRRIVATATQEWAFFGFQVEDQRGTAPIPGQPNQNNNRRRFGALNPVEVQRVADSVGGYWAAAPGSDWILARQNEAWNSPQGLASRYRDPWSAAFISWVMCESGLGDRDRFERAIAHHSYIDQAIKARDGKLQNAAYLAYDPGEEPINPGDMLCSGLRPMYRSLQQRRDQLGEGARTHCDIVVQVNELQGLVLTIGGNVRSSVRLKIFPAAAEGANQFAPLPTARTIFAHLKLQTDPIDARALEQTPTLLNIDCGRQERPRTFGVASIELPPASCAQVN